MIRRCPGSNNMRTPTLAVEKCPGCGEDIEVFSTDPIIRCKSCGWNSDNCFQSCYNWCRFAELCKKDFVA
jgi:hypothetical protein